MKIYPSIASADPLRIAEELDKIRGYPRVHVDIEDGNFLPNITFGQKTVRKLMQDPDFVYDLHLLTTRPYEFIFLIFVFILKLRLIRFGKSI